MERIEALPPKYASIVSESIATTTSNPKKITYNAAVLSADSFFSTLGLSGLFFDHHHHFLGSSWSILYRKVSKLLKVNPVFNSLQVLDTLMNYVFPEAF